MQSSAHAWASVIWAGKRDTCNITLEVSSKPVKRKCSPEMPLILGLRVSLRWYRAPYYTLGHFLPMLSLI